MVTFKTLNSTYQVDKENKLVRRLNGIKAPTPRQGPDGEWKGYEEITDIEVGHFVLIVWKFDAEVGVTIGRSTITSDVVSVEEVN